MSPAPTQSASQIHNWPISARLLRALARPAEAADYPGGTERHVGDHSLDFVLATVPNFLDLIRDKQVLDYGCGLGDQALAMKRAGAAHVTGYDPYPKFRQAIDGVEFTTELPQTGFDIVLSCSAFEHFSDPEKEVAAMRRITTGKLVITWAEPWFSHSGSHMNFFTRLPWVNLLFPEKSVMLVRSLYRNDGATSYETAGLGGALNRMTVARFESIISQCGMQIEQMRLFATLKLPLVTQMPVLRELLTSACACVLTAVVPTGNLGAGGRS